MPPFLTRLKFSPSQIRPRNSSYLKTMRTNTSGFCAVFEYWRKADLSRGSWNQKRTLGVTAQFSEIIELQFGPKMPCIVFYLRALCSCNKGYHSRNSEIDLAIQKPQSNSLKRSVKYSGAMLWNNLYEFTKERPKALQRWIL